MKVICTHKYWICNKSDREVQGTPLTMGHLKNEFPEHFVKKDFRRPNLEEFRISSEIAVEVDGKEVFSANVTSRGTEYGTSVVYWVKPIEVYAPTPEMIQALTEIRHSHYEALRKAEL